MKGETFMLAGWFKGFTTLKDHAKLTLGISHNQLTRLQKGALSEYGPSEKEVFIMLKTAEFDAAEVEAMDAAEVPTDENSKPLSQRQRAKMYVIWKNSETGYEDFELYYAMRMRKNLDFLQRELDNLQI